MVIYTSELASILPIPEITLPEYMLSNPFGVEKDRVIILGLEGRSLTFGQYCDSISNVASGLRHVAPEVVQGDVVCLLSPNTFEYPSLVLGISGSGAIPAMVNPSATPSELAHSFKLVSPEGPKVLFCHPDLLEGAYEGLKLSGFTRKTRIIAMIPSGTLPNVAELMLAGSKNRKPLAKLSGPSETTTAMLFYSSGTTGAFKAVKLSHRNLIANAKQLLRANEVEFTKEAVMLTSLPNYHIYSSCLAIVSLPLAGVRTVNLPKFELPLYLESIQNHKVTHTFLVPPMAVAFAKHPIVDNYDLKSLRVLSIAAAPTGLELVQQLRRRLGVKVTQGYGMTEAAPGTHQLNPPDEKRDGSVGKLYADMLCRLVDDEGKDVPEGAEGEILLSGPNIMLGYVRNEEATKDTVRDGWLHTGDIGRRCPDGFYYITGRSKELIKVRGFQVAPGDLEGLLLAIPYVLDCAVTSGYDSEKATEYPIAFVVVDPANRTPQKALEIRALVDSKVAYYKQLTGGVHFLDAIPKNPSGKILRRVLPKDVAKPPVSKAKM